MTSPYCASKFGVISFTQSVALEVGMHNVTINAVCPGPANTELFQQSIAQFAKLNDVTEEEYLQKVFIDPTPWEGSLNQQMWQRLLFFLLQTRRNS